MHHVLIYTNEADWLAARIPGAKYGTIEVRPVLELTSEHRSAHHAALSRCSTFEGSWRWRLAGPGGGPTASVPPAAPGGDQSRPRASPVRARRPASVSST
jgi:hypothetical protein